MTVKPLFAACITALLAAPALIQPTSGKPSSLKLSPNSLPAFVPSSPRSVATQPGMHHGDPAATRAHGSGSMILDNMSHPVCFPLQGTSNNLVTPAKAGVQRL